MKKFIYIPLVLLAAVSCRELLDGKSCEEISKKDYMNNPSEAEGVLYGVYRYMVTDGLYGFHLSMLFPLGTDIAACEGRTTVNFRTIPANYHTASTAEIETSWSTIFSAICSASDFIESLPPKAAMWEER
ncbi:MAG: RagB/SusD family nutrient uptake outer membrane protein, partial [Rikenellaceae bacterium]|nr:RagB/SusD family nutrient uptake outer membrane protein [Rikenellaceae bacterium]